MIKGLSFIKFYGILFIEVFLVVMYREDFWLES